MFKYNCRTFVYYVYYAYILLFQPHINIHKMLPKHMNYYVIVVLFVEAFALADLLKGSWLAFY